MYLFGFCHFLNWGGYWGLILGLYLFSCVLRYCPFLVSKLFVSSRGVRE